MAREEKRSPEGHDRADRKQDRVRELFEAAFELEPRERSAYLSEQCGENAALRSAVEKLLAAAEAAGSFLEDSPIQSAQGLESGQVVSHYRLVEKLDEGGMGIVWEAQDIRLKRHVALKILPPELIEDPQRRIRFQREAQAAAALNHPNIAAVYEVGEADGVSFIAMELIRGRTLRSLIQGRPLPIPEAVRVGQEMVSALSQAHQAGIIHRDLKPDNVMIGPGQCSKVIDFGLAKLLQAEEQHRSQVGLTERLTENLTLQGVLLGTATYMSPEQARGDAVDTRSDIFSFGVMLYEMVTGSPPFRGATRLDILSSIIKDGFEPAAKLNPLVPAELDLILARCLDKEPAGRYPHAGELLEHLQRLKKNIESGSGGSPSRALASLLQRSSWTRPKLVRVALGALGLAVLFTAAWMARSLLPASADPARILILPMEVHGQGEGADHAGRAFAETLAVELARSADLTILRVPESTEAGSSGGSAGVKAALDAGAGRLVSGTLNRAGNNLHASITLLDTTRGRVIWGLRKEAAGDSLSSLASTLASELTAHLGGKRPRQYGHFSYSTESRALANSPEWVEAVGATRRFEVEAASRATRRLMEIFPAEPDSRVLRSNALLFEAWGMPASSPQFAQFQASLADIHRVDPDNPWDEVLGAFARKQRGAHREAVEQLTSVLSREDLTPAARAFILSLRGDAKAYDNDYTGAFADLNGALELDPANNVNYLTLAAALLRVGRIEEGFARARQAVALVPTSAPNNDQLGRSLLMMGRYEESLAPMKKACEGRRIYCTGYGRALSLAGHPDQALPRLAELCDSAPPDASRWAFSAASNCIEYACALAREGQVQKAHAAARKADGSPEQQELLYGKARYRALAGDRAEAIRLLKRSVELGLVVGWIDQDPDFVSLHGDPDFAAVVSQVKERLSYP